jgi:hypothetical protein
LARKFCVGRNFFRASLGRNPTSQKQWHCAGRNHKKASIKRWVRVGGTRQSPTSPQDQQCQLVDVSFTKAIAPYVLRLNRVQPPSTSAMTGEGYQFLQPEQIHRPGFVVWRICSSQPAGSLSKLARPLQKVARVCTCAMSRRASLQIRLTLYRGVLL